MLTQFELGPWTVDLVRAEARQDGRTERLTTRECDLLGFLYARAGEDVERETLHREVGLRAEVVSRGLRERQRRGQAGARLRRRLDAGHVRRPLRRRYKTPRIQPATLR